MSYSFYAALAWLIVANVIGMFPSKHKHWPQAYALIAIGLPILVWVFFENGAVFGLAVLFAAMSVLRWPVRFLLRWLKTRTVS
jgi:hypothetical protein